MTGCLSWLNGLIDKHQQNESVAGVFKRNPRWSICIRVWYIQNKNANEISSKIEYSWKRECYKYLVSKYPVSFGIVAPWPS